MKDRRELPRLLVTIAAAILSFVPAIPVQAEIVVDGRRARTMPPIFCNLGASDGRYLDCSTVGVVYDTLLGIFWLKDASCDVLGQTLQNGSGSYAHAQEIVATIGQGFDCDGDGTIDLNDGSTPGSWRLPSLAEWTTTRAKALACSLPAMLQDDGLACYGGGSGSSFVGIESSFLYWSGSADEADPGKAFVYDMVDGDLLTDFKAASHVIWPVRDPGSPGGPDGEVMVGTTYIDTRQDGPCQNLLGVGSERYVDCGNGTVLDLATGLIWVADPSCLSLPFALAIQGTSSFADGFCGLTDGSQPGDWRLPTQEEWQVTTPASKALRRSPTPPAETA